MEVAEILTFITRRKALVSEVDQVQNISKGSAEGERESGEGFEEDRLSAESRLAYKSELGERDCG